MSYAGAVTSCSKLIIEARDQLLPSRHMRTGVDKAHTRVHLMHLDSKGTSYKAVCPTFFERERHAIMFTLCFYSTTPQGGALLLSEAACNELPWCKQLNIYAASGLKKVVACLHTRH